MCPIFNVQDSIPGVFFKDITKTDYNTNKEVPLPKQRNLSHAREEDFDKYGPDSSGKR